MIRLNFILPFLFSISIMTGCAGQQKPSQAQSLASDAMYQQLSYNQVLSEHTAAVGKKVNGVDDAVSVVMGEDISIAIKVTGIDRFRLKGIKSEVANQLKKDLSDRYTIHVTTDKKLFQDLQSLQKKMNQGQSNPKDIMKSFKKINKDMHG
ncbi:YhcN/YlaJ family sporulation lipoprotein [Ammoniphilus sp. 3BR4]|uniref:YhcN/YlaJ family sporulation lipoprotein n=1 Tax=Ammoniphilus sp. 3BR4 TaxID=3158265 RepID=UPI003466C71A